MEHLTPEQAWPHVKALCPSAEYILKHKRFQCEVIGSGRQTYVAAAEIDWPEGVTQWPPPEPQYREPRMPEDWGKEIHWAYDPTQTWHKGTLGGKKEHDVNPKWIVIRRDGGIELAKHARIRVDDDGWKPMDSAPKNERIRVKMGSIETIAEWSRAGSIWVSESPHGIAWDRANQPTAWKEIE